MEKVFVYGTLMRGFKNHDKVLKNRVRHTIKGKTTGKLYHLPAGYPAIIDGKSEVHGEVFTLSQAKTMKSLDLLEGYIGEGKDNLYERQKKQVYCEDGTVEECWVYVYADQSYVERKGEKVEAGCWAEFMNGYKS